LAITHIDLKLGELALIPVNEVDDLGTARLQAGKPGLPAETIRSLGEHDLMPALRRHARGLQLGRPAADEGQSASGQRGRGERHQGSRARVTKLDEGLRFGPLGNSWVHLCVDMQRMFAEPTEWHTPWMERVLPNVVAVVELDPARTVFTRFIPPRSAERPAARGGGTIASGTR
jgi:hypothetical protein